MHTIRPIYVRFILLLCIWFLTACTASSGVVLPVTPSPQVTATPTVPPSTSTTEPSTTPTTQATQEPTAVAPTAVAQTTVPQPEPTRWTVGLLDQPGTLVPFSPDGRAAAPLIEAMFPAPALALNYAYTTTGVLVELPTYQNAGLERRPVDGFLDASGHFTTTATVQPTTTEQLVVTFRWHRSLRWADGTALTAHDSVFAYEEARRLPATPEMAGMLDLVESYEALDDYT